MLGLFKIDIRGFILGFISLTIVDVGQTVIPYIVGRAINYISDFRKVLYYFVIIILLSIMSAVFRFFWRYLIIGASRKIEKKIRSSIFEKINCLSEERAKNLSGYIVSLSTNDAEAVRMALGIGSVIAYDASLFLIMIVFAMFIISPYITLFVFLPMPLLIFVVVRFGNKIFTKFLSVQDYFSRVTEFVQRSVSTPKILKAMNQEEKRSKDFFDISDEYAAKQIDLIKTSSLFNPLLVLISGISTAVFIFVGSIFISKKISVGDFASLSLYLSTLSWPVMAIGFAIDFWKKGMASYKRIREFIDEKSDLTGTELKPKNITPRNYICIKRGNLDIRCGEGEILLIGKDSENPLFNVLGGLQDQTNEIKVEIPENFFLVSQKPVVFSGTVYENITVFGEYTIEEVERAAEMACILDEIKRFEKGFFTYVGESGITLSGGQRQRICLARAFIRKPRALLLDDPLVWVDEETSSEIYKNIRDFAKKNKVIVVIATHNPDECRDIADKFILL